MGAGDELEVWAAQDRVQVGPRRRKAPSAIDVAVERGEPFLPVPVDVVGQWVTRFLHRAEEGAKERVGCGSAFEFEGAVMPAVRVARVAVQARFEPPEIGEAVGPIPGRHPRQGAPFVVVQLSVEPCPAVITAAFADN